MENQNDINEIDIIIYSKINEVNVYDNYNLPAYAKELNINIYH